MAEQEFYISKYYTSPEIDQRLLQGLYDDAVKMGYPRSKTEFESQLASVVSSKRSSDNEELEDPYISLITEALRKTPQTLTEAEKTQVRENLSIPSVSDLTAEKTRAEQAEKDNADNISLEAERAKEAERILSDRIDDIKPVIIEEGSITNNADEEDLTAVDEVLKFKDRDSLNGMGYVILRKNKTFAEQVTNANTIYEIRYDFDLNGEEVTIPEDCVLKFEGGSLRNGSIYFNNTRIYTSINNVLRNIQLVNDSIFGGTVNLSWFSWDNSYSIDNFNKLCSIYKAVNETHYTVIWDINELYLLQPSIESIPLSVEKIHDFNNCAVHIKTEVDQSYLFELLNERIDTNYKKISEAVNDNFFKGSQGLLFVYDQTPLHERKGYGFNYYRFDTLLVQDNILISEPILPYDTDVDTDAKISFYDAKRTCAFINLKIYRQLNETKKVSILNAEGLYNFTIDNVHFISDTSSNGMEGDIAFDIKNSYGLSVSNFSSNSMYGLEVGTGIHSYVFHLFGCTNTIFSRVNCHSKWHTFGNRCINGFSAYNCHFHGFDNHTYGSNYLFENCTFKKEYIALPTVGYATYNNCVFDECYILNFSERPYCFNTTITYNNCVFNMSNTHLIKIDNVVKLDEGIRTLLDIEEDCNININNCVCNTLFDTENVFIFYGNNASSNYYCNLSLKNLILNAKTEASHFYISGNTNSRINVKIDGISKGNDICSYEAVLREYENIRFKEINNVRIPINTINLGAITIKNSDIVGNPLYTYKFSLENCRIKYPKSEVYQIKYPKLDSCEVIFDEEFNTSNYVIHYSNDETWYFRNCKFSPASIMTRAKPSEYTEDEVVLLQQALSKCEIKGNAFNANVQRAGAVYSQFKIINMPRLTEEELNIMIKFSLVYQMICVVNNTVTYCLDNKTVTKEEYESKVILGIVAANSTNNIYKITGNVYFDTIRNKPVYYNGTDWIIDSGTSAQRPTGINDGFEYYDTTIRQPIYWNESRQGWINADGYAAGVRSGRWRIRKDLQEYLTGLDGGLQFFDLSLGKVVVWTGYTWVNVDGSGFEDVNPEEE